MKTQITMIWLAATLAVRAAEISIDWNKAQQAAFGARDIKVAGVLNERIDRTINGNIRQLEVDRDFIKPFREKKLPVQGGLKGARAIETGNLIEAVALLAALRKDQALYDSGAKMVAELIACQEPDGYLGTFPKEMRGRKAGWDTEDVANMILGLLAWHELYGTPGALEAARKSMEHMIATWDFKGTPFIGLEEAFVRLSAATGDRKYFEFYVKNFFPNGQLDKYWTSKVGLTRPDKIISGEHNYRAMTINRGMLLMYEKLNDAKLLESTDGMAKFLRGGGGSVSGISGYGESALPTHFGRSGLDHPKYSKRSGGMRHTGETCSNAWLPLLGHKRQALQLAAGETDAWWMDASERTLLNGFFSGQSADGRRIRYGTEFEGIRYWSHLDTFCCPNNYRRTVAYLPKLMFSSASDRVSLHLYAPSVATFDLAGVPVIIKQETAYPADGKIDITVDPVKPVEFTLQLRVPVWAQGAKVKINGKAVAVTPGQYASIHRNWKKGDKVALDLPMEWKWITGIYEQTGRAALMHGPMTFTFNPTREGNEIPGYKEPDYDQSVITHEQDRPGYSRKLYSTGFPDWELSYELLRKIVIDPASVGKLEMDSARPGGLVVKVKAQLPGVDGWREITLTDFPDEGGRTMHFLLSKPPANLVKDPVFSPRQGESLFEQTPASEM